MKCPNCNGQRYKAPDVPCGRCGGKGVVEPLTNEEYIRTCSTGDLAVLIYQDRWMQSDGWYEQTGHTVEDVKNWLKEIHDA